MGFFEKIFGPRKPVGAQQARETFEFLEGYTTAFHSFAGSIYESELIRAALDAHGRHAAKLRPLLSGSAKPNLQNRLRVAPNPWQTWPGFLYQCATVLYAKNNVFIVPVLGEYDEPNGITIVVPHEWELVEYKGEAFIRFKFQKQKNIAIELNRVGIVTRFQMENQIFGPDNEALRPTLSLIEIQRKGIIEGIKNHSNYKFMASSSNWSKEDDLEKERKRFDAHNFRGDSGGILLFPNTYKDIKQINPSQFNVSETESKIIKDNVFDYFAVNEDVIQNKAFGDAWLAFYEGAIEWLAINLSESITRMLFSERERQFGNTYFLTSNRLQYMSNGDKLNAISALADRGLMTRNELRDILNLSPLPAPYGDQIPARGEYYNVNEQQEASNAEQSE